MTNEQNAIQLKGYLSELNNAMSDAEKLIKPTIRKNNAMQKALSGCDETETFPELEGMEILAERIQRDIDILCNIKPVFGN